MQAGSKACGTLRTAERIRKMAAAYSTGHSNALTFCDAQGAPEAPSRCESSLTDKVARLLRSEST